MEKLARDSLLRKFNKLRTKKFYDVGHLDERPGDDETGEKDAEDDGEDGPGTNVIKLFTAVSYSFL
jgi:hypothetical protein